MQPFLTVRIFSKLMAEDEKIRVIAMYLESAKNARIDYCRLPKRRAKKKPIILWKGGESKAGAATATSHTGGMSGSAKVMGGILPSERSGSCALDG